MVDALLWLPGKVLGHLFKPVTGMLEALADVEGPELF